MFKLLNHRKPNNLLFLLAGLLSLFISVSGCGNSGTNDNNTQTRSVISKEILLSDFTSPISVTFSPQSELYGYTAKLISIIDSSQARLDIALYGFDSGDVHYALKRATARGVQIRMLFEDAKEDRKQNSGTSSHSLEILGIDIRYVNKILHHKFLISDDAFAVTSSGNWNVQANSVYDENTLFISDEELISRYRNEFDLLWQNSREFGENIYPTESNTNTNPFELSLDPTGRNVYFTSANYTTYISSTYGPTFEKIPGSQVVADKIVELINQSTQLIYMASNHMRSRPIAEALITKKQQHPEMDIRLYLDEQEYVSDEYNQIQIAEREECLANASTPGEIRECTEKNFYYSYELIKAGINVKFKTYSYKWHQNTAALMHHKYAIFDNQIVATGSYNYSYNSETNSMENMLVFDNSFSAETASTFMDNFLSIWNTGRDEGYYNDLMENINSTTRYVPVVYPSMSLTYNEIRSLRVLTVNTCPAVTDEYFKSNCQYFSVFPKGLDLSCDSTNKLISVHDMNDSFSINYQYNENDAVTSVNFQSNDNLFFNETYGYDGNGNLIQLSSPQFNLTFNYDNYDQLSALNYGQGNHTWLTETNNSGSLTRYSTHFWQSYFTIQLNKDQLPLNLTDSDDRTLSWQYDTDNNVSSIASQNRTISYSFNDKYHDWLVSTNDNESIHFEQPNIDKINITMAGTVLANVSYSTVEQQDKSLLLNINIVSNHVASGTGKNASAEYVFDPYGRVVKAGAVIITRKPFSGKITSISCNGITESRSYNSWDELVSQQVNYNGQIYYKVEYLYDGLHRIKSFTENISGNISSFIYSYDNTGRLTSVTNNGTIVEVYSYDQYGNRTQSISTELTENYSYNNGNRLTERSWQSAANLRKAEYSYNNSGQLLYTAYKTINNNGQYITKERNYDYDVFGNLNKVSWANQTQEYKYDPYDRPVVRIQNGSKTGSYIYGFGQTPLAELNENGRIINVYLYAEGITPIVMQKAGSEYYFISDIRGSPRLIVKSSTGVVRQKITYDFFGRVLEDTNPGYTPFGYAGGIYDNRTDLVRFGARDYQPETGRWTSEDPIGFLSGDVNFYAYVTNDPVNYIDPSGLSDCGITVLGKYPDYINLADKLGARRFSVPSEIWDNMTKTERWEANQKFLDRTITRGDRIILSNPVKNIKTVSGSFREELDYLIRQGFNFNPDGTCMCKY